MVDGNGNTGNSLGSYWTNLAEEAASLLLIFALLSWIGRSGNQASEAESMGSSRRPATRREAEGDGEHRRTAREPATTARREAAPESAANGTDLATEERPPTRLNQGVSRLRMGANERGRFLLGQGLHRFWRREYAGAAEDFSVALSAAPHDPAPHYFLALVHKRQGQDELAEEKLKAAVKWECLYGLEDYAALMQRVQGHERRWIEACRALAGLR